MKKKKKSKGRYFALFIYLIFSGSIDKNLKCSNQIRFKNGTYWKETRMEFSYGIKGVIQSFATEFR
jgi:hypothetical protein